MNIEHLRNARERLGWNQKQFSAELGISQQRYNYYETGKREPDNEMLLLIARTLQVNVNYLLGNSSDMAPPVDGSESDEVWKIREELQKRPEMKILFDASRNATKEDILKAVKIIEALKETSL